tara:strand:- start:4526 stop:5044 length:519 start_codon:yes stop_codon:yes gene_type:complete
MNLPKNLFLFLVFSVCFFSFGQQNQETISNLIFKKTNLLRKAKDLKPFKKLDTLDYLAQYHSDNMVLKKFYEHIDHEGLSPVERAEKLNIQAWRREGNKFVGIAENIAQVPWFENVVRCGDTRSNEAIAECLVQGWKKSPPHYKNILGDYVYLGVGISFDADQMGFATQNFR